MNGSSIFTIEELNSLQGLSRKDPILAEYTRQFYIDRFRSAKQDPAVNNPGMPDLPDTMKLDTAAGVGSETWVDQYMSYARSVSPMTPDLFHESAALFLAGVAIARRLRLPMPFGDIYPNLFIVWLANTTLYRKSTALAVARDFAYAVFPFLLAAQDTTPEAFLSDLSGMKPSNYENMSRSGQEDWEKERSYAAQRGWILDEISGLMSGAGKDYNAGLIESLLRFYDCDPCYTRSTKSGGRIIVKNSSLSFLGASTPASMSQYFTTERLWSMGWWPRFAILTPEGRPDWQNATAKERPPELLSELQRLFQRFPNETKWPDPPRALIATLGEGVFDLWSKYNKVLSHDLLTDDLPQQLWGSYGRLPTQALKVAMILAALDWKNQPAPQIEYRHIVRATTITESWRESVHRAISTATETDFTRTAERTIKVIGKWEPKGATLRDICKATRDKWPGDIQAVIDEMLIAGMIEKVTTGNDGKRGRPTVKYVLLKE